MKKLWFIPAVLLSAVVYAQQAQSFQLKGKIGNYNDVKAYLAYEEDGNKIVDSATLHNGTFFFKGTLTQPTQAKLFLASGPHPLFLSSQVLNSYGPGSSSGFHALSLTEGMFRHFFDWRAFYLDKGTVSITGKDSVKTAMISGSGYPKQLNQEYLAFLTAFIHGEKQLLYALTPEGQQLSKDDLDQFKKIQAQGEKEMDSSMWSFLQNHPSSYATLDIMRTYFNWGSPFVDTQKAALIYNSLSPRLKNSYEGKLDVQRIEVARAFAIGNSAPDFSLNDLNGQPVRLSDFHGKYVLLDFWFRACHPCREEMPFMKAAYEKYKDKNFIIVAVCVDKPQNMRTAIHEDGTEAWVHLNDTTYGKSAAVKEYKVEFNGYPSNFLIGPDGRFLAKDLHHEDYEKKLSGILK